MTMEKGFFKKRPNPAPFSFLMSVKDSEDSCVQGKTLSIKGADDFNLIWELVNWASNMKTERRNDFIFRKERKWILNKNSIMSVLIKSSQSLYKWLIQTNRDDI